MTMTVIKQGTRYTINDAQNAQSFDKLPAGTYAVKFDERSGSFFLEQTSNMNNPSKLYGDTRKKADRIINTFNSRTNQTGVLLSGEKGSGKTLLAREVSIKMIDAGVPTLLINEAHCGETFNQFIQSIDQPCVVIFDEFEKVYNEEKQERMLTLLDGVYPSKKLFIITVNDKYRINFAMRNRPGRLFYAFEYKGLSEEFVREYCADQNLPQNKTDQLVKISNFFYSFNFDMLKAIVEECIRYDEMPAEVVDYVNASPESDARHRFTIKVKTLDGKDVQTHNNEITASPLREEVYVGILDKLTRSNLHLDNCYTEDDIDETNDEKFNIDFKLSRDQIVEINNDGKTYVYKNSCYCVTLTRKIEREFDYRAF